MSTTVFIVQYIGQVGDCQIIGVRSKVWDAFDLAEGQSGFKGAEWDQVGTSVGKKAWQTKEYRQFDGKYILVEEHELL